MIKGGTPVGVHKLEDLKYHSRLLLHFSNSGMWWNSWDGRCTRPVLILYKVVRVVSASQRALLGSGFTPEAHLAFDFVDPLGGPVLVPVVFYEPESILYCWLRILEP